MRKRKSSSVPQGAPAWMNTYGDMVTLLLTFFVLLFSFSTVDANKMKQFLASFSNNIGILDGGLSLPEGEKLGDLPTDGDNVNRLADTENIEQELAAEMQSIENFMALYQKILQYVEERDLQTKVEVTGGTNEIRISFLDNVLFDSAKADLKPEASSLLAQISEALTAYQDDIQLIRVEGHTDNLPIRTPQFPTNWELSTARATNVTRFFVEKAGINPMSMAAAGYSEYHPVADNSTPEGRGRNRRVEIYLTRARFVQPE